MQQTHFDASRLHFLRTFNLRQPAGTKVEDARSLLESAVHFSESTFKAVWDGSIQEQPAKLQGGQRDCVVAQRVPVLAAACMLRWGGSIQQQPAKFAWWTRRLKPGPGGLESAPGSAMTGCVLGPTMSALLRACPLQRWWRQWSRCCSGSCHYRWVGLAVALRLGCSLAVCTQHCQSGPLLGELLVRTTWLLDRCILGLCTAAGVRLAAHAHSYPARSALSSVLTQSLVAMCTRAGVRPTAHAAPGAWAGVLPKDLWRTEGPGSSRGRQVRRRQAQWAVALEAFPATSIAHLQCSHARCLLAARTIDLVQMATWSSV